MNFINFIKRFRHLILVACVLAIAAGTLLSLRLNLDPSLNSRFLRDNPQINTYKDLQKSFGTEPLITVVWEAGGDILEEKNLIRLKELTGKLNRVEGVESLISLAGLSEENNLETKILKSLPLVRKLLLGREGQRAVIAIIPRPEAITPSEGSLLVNRIESVVNNFVASSETAFVTGPIAMQSKAIEYSRRDLFIAVIIVGIVCILLFGFAYRTWRAVTAALLVAASSISISCGLLAACGAKLSQFALIAIPILAAISLQDVVHLVEHFYDTGLLRSARNDKSDKRVNSAHVIARRPEANVAISRCKNMFEACLTPCIWTTVTTAAAFAALLLSDIEQIRSIGLIVIIGTPIALLISLVIVPALLMGDAKSTDYNTAADYNNVVAGVPAGHKLRPAGTPATTFVQFLKRHSPRIAIILILFTLLTSYGIRFAHIEFNFPQIFKSSLPFQKQIAEADEKLSGGTSFEIMMETTDGSDFTDPEKFKLIQNMQLAMSLTAPVTTTVSPIDVGLTAYVLENGIPENPKELWKKRTTLVRELRNVSGSPLENWLSEDLTKVRIHARARTDKQKHYDKMIQALNFLKNGFAKVGVKVSWSGFALLYKEMEKTMLGELVKSFAIAFLGVTLLLMILFRSIKWGLLATIPNLLPIIVTIGIMGWAGAGFSLGLIILPAVGIGLVVDDTIHIVWGMKRNIHRGLEPTEAITRVLSTTGRALTLSTIILITGFASLATSNFISNTQLAIFMPILLLLALLFDFVGVPVTIFLRKAKR